MYNMKKEVGFEPWYGQEMHQNIFIYLNYLNGELEQDAAALNKQAKHLARVKLIRDFISNLDERAGRVVNVLEKEIIAPDGELNHELPSESPDASEIVNAIRGCKESLIQAKDRIGKGVAPCDDVIGWFRAIVDFYEGVRNEVSAERDFWRKIATVGKCEATTGINRTVLTEAYRLGIAYIECLRNSHFKDDGFRSRVEVILAIFEQIVDKRRKIGGFEYDEKAGVSPYAIPSVDVLCQANPVSKNWMVRRIQESIRNRRVNIWSQIKAKIVASQKIANPVRQSEITPESAGIHFSGGIDDGHVVRYLE